MTGALLTRIRQERSILGQQDEVVIVGEQDVAALSDNVCLLAPHHCRSWHTNELPALFSLGLVRVVQRQPELLELRLIEVEDVVSLLLVRVARVLGELVRVVQVVAGGVGVVDDAFDVGIRRIILAFRCLIIGHLARLGAGARRLRVATTPR